VGGRPADGGDGGEHGTGAGGTAVSKAASAAPSAGCWDPGGVTDYSVRFTTLVHKMASSLKKE
jgi:hypothetical protein